MTMTLGVFLVVKHVRPNPDVAPHLHMIMIMIMIIIIIIIIITTKNCATPSEQYVDWGNNINLSS